MAKFLKWGFEDKVGHKGFAGCYVPDSVTMAAALLFVQSLVALSDALLYSISLEEKLSYDPDLATAGEHGVEERGTVELVKLSDARLRVKVGIPAVSQDNVDLNGLMPEKVTDGAAEATLTNYETMIGEAGLWKVQRQPVSIRQRR